MANETLTPTMSKLLATLKRHNPSKVRAFAGDDDARDIAVPTRRKKWGQVVEAIEARSWTRVELLDKGGAVLAYVDNVEPARELEDITDNGKSSKTRSDAEWIVALAIKAQRDAMTFRDAEVTNLLRAQGDVVRELTGAMHGLAQIFRAQVDVARETEAMKTAAAAEQAAAAAGNGDGFKELLDALPTLLQALPVIRAMIQPAPQQPTQRPKNGA